MSMLISRTADRPPPARSARFSGRTKRHLMSMPVSHHFGDPHAALRSFAVTERTAWGQRHPVNRVPDGEFRAGRPGVEFGTPNGARHVLPPCVSQISHKDAVGPP